MRLAINLILSLGMLALCTWLVWPGAQERVELVNVLRNIDWVEMSKYLAGYFALQLIVHVCRSLRWNHLLAPLGVRVPAGPLLAISSVGFLAILALPVRLGEFVRPGLLRLKGYATATASLGTVAVERIVDGLMISLLVFCAFFAERGPTAPGWMMPTAYGALGVFAAAMIFLVFAMRRPEPTVRFCIGLTLLPRFAPAFAAKIEHWLLDMIRGLGSLRDVRNLLLFFAWSVVYWVANGLGVWMLAHAFHLELSVVGALATMGLLGVGISLPNSPGLVGQFQWFTLLGLSVYLGFDPKHPPPAEAAVAITHHLLQVAWYVAMGGLALLTPWVSFHDLRIARKALSDDVEADAAAAAVNGPAESRPAAPVARAESNGVHAKKLAPEPRSADDPLHAPDRS